MAATSEIYHDYAFVDVEATNESSRLNTQYDLIKNVFDHPNLLPDEIDQTKLSRILEVACGTGIWSLDISNLPTIRKTREDAGSMDAVQIYASDIDTSRFPPSNVAKRSGVKFLQQDITEDFADESMYGTFDLVRVALVVFAFTKPGWSRMLKNVRRLLKPDGVLLLQDVDTFLYPSAGLPQPPIGPVFDQDIEALLQSDSETRKLNSVYAGNSLRRGLVPNINTHIPGLLQDEGLSILSAYRVLVPSGDLCHTVLSRRGDSLARYADSSVINFMEIMEMLTEGQLRRGELEAPIGNPLVSESEREELMCGFEGIFQRGTTVVAMEWIARNTTTRKALRSAM